MTMSLPLAVLFVACLAAGASATGQKGGVSLVDLKSLEQFLEKYTPYGEPGGNLALIKYELDYGRPGAKRAGEFLLALDAVKECTDDALDKLFHVAAFRENFKDFGPMCRRLVQFIGDKLIQTCGNYLAKKSAANRAELVADAKVAKLFEVMTKAHATVGYGSLSDPSRVTLKGSFLKKLLEEGSAPIAGDRTAFDSFYEANIVEPCKKVTEVYGDIYKKTAALANHRYYAQFSAKGEKTTASKEMQDIIWAFNSCNTFLSANDMQRTRMLEEMS